jgi:hypothetical protein
MSGDHKRDTNVSGRSTHKMIKWSAVIAASIIFCGGVCLYLQRSHSLSFLGSETRLIEQCKRNPDSHPEKCDEILAARSGRPTKRANKNISGGIPQANFRLSED